MCECFRVLIILCGLIVGGVFGLVMFLLCLIVVVYVLRICVAATFAYSFINVVKLVFEKFFMCFDLVMVIKFIFGVILILCVSV